MKFKLAFATAAALLGFTAASQAGAPVQMMIYNVDAAAQCSHAAAGTADLRQGLYYCDTALRDPLMSRRGALLLNRGIINARLNDVGAALGDYNNAIALDPSSGDAYVSRAGAYIAMKRYDAASADLARGLQLGTAEPAVAYFSRATIEDEQGNYQAAYHDYKQALALKPDYAAASRELARFKVTRRTAAN